MCGIVGEFSANVKPVVIQSLMEKMRKRGPDDSGFWTDCKRCAMGFQRLSILDLSPLGHQPMLSADSRYALVFNGEIYNYGELRSSLIDRGAVFRSSGDTEVLLQALIYWGKDALSRLNGMFAFAFYDSHEQRLMLARDHAGIKPLYYMITSEGLVFASQYNQLTAHPLGRNLSISSESLRMYLEMGYIPSPFGMMANTYSLPAGGWLEITPDTTKQGRYFTYPSMNTPDLTGNEAIEAVDSAVSAAVKRQLISDVPVGAFLSGGIDSPLVAAKIAQISPSLQTFTIGVTDPQLDEAADAQHYAQLLGLPNTTLHITAQNALAILNQVIDACNEPLADISIFPTFLVSELARQHVTVALSGDGGDELFWGYPTRFGRVLRAAAYFAHPYYLRLAGYALSKVLQRQVVPRDVRWRSIGERYRSAHSGLAATVVKQIIPDIADWPKEFELFHFSENDEDRTAQWLRWNEYTGHLSRILMKVDRASMFHSLEVRVPLLDKELVELSTRIDWHTCLDVEQNVGKRPLREALKRYVSHQTLQKKGFVVPMGDWLRHELRPEFEETVMRCPEIFGLPIRRKALRQFYDEHLDGSHDHSVGLWTLLSLFKWKEVHLAS